MERLVVERAKFLEDIYASECQIVIKASRESARRVQRIEAIREIKVREVPEWVEKAVVGEFF